MKPCSANTCGKSIGTEVGEFLLTQGRQRIERFQLGIDETRMTHDQGPIWQARQEPGKDLGKFRFCVKSVGAGKSRVEGNSQAPGLATKGHAQDVEHQGLAVQCVSARVSAAALPYPGVWRSLRNHLEKSVTDLRKQVHMLMAVHEIGRAAETCR